MRIMVRRTAMASALMASALMAVAGRSDAEVIVTATEVGGDVVFQAGGELDLDGLDLFFSGKFGGPIVDPSQAHLVVGPPFVNFDAYSGLTGPSNFGAASFTIASSGSGDRFGLNGTVGLLAVPVGYTPDAPLSGSATYSGATLASLGLNPGTYVYTLPHDTITVQIGTVQIGVPEPSSLVLAGIGVVIGGGCWWRRRRGRATA